MATPSSRSTSRPALPDAAGQCVPLFRRLRLAALAVPVATFLLLPGVALASDPIFHDDFESGELDAWSPDEAQLRALIDGPPPESSQVVAVLETIGRSFGLPVHTQDDSYLFAADCGTELYDLVGDFNAWVPETMMQSGALCYLEKTIAEPVESKYKFYLDPPTWFADARARRFQYDQFGEISLVRSSLAHLERWFGFGPEQGLSVRQLHVWVPADRAFDRILYLHDGQNLFDPAAPWGGWQLQDALPVGVLAVGIHNTAQRCDEYTPTWDAAFACGGDAPLYAALVHQTIRPFVEKRYGAGSHRGLLGSSLGGLVSLYIALQFPGQYDFAGSLSGSFWWDSDWIVSAYAGAGHGTTRVYLDSGGGGSCPGGDTDNYCVTLQMRDTLLANGYVLDTDLWYFWESGAQHNEAAWAARVWRPLTHFAGI